MKRFCLLIINCIYFESNKMIIPMRRYIILLTMVVVCSCNKIFQPVIISSDADINEYYSPKGNVISVKLADGNVVYMDEDSVFFLGDITFGKDQIQSVLSPQTKGAVIKNYVRYWTSFDIPFYISTDFSLTMRNKILSGISMITSACPLLNFYEVTSIPSSGICFVLSSDGSWSSIGKQSTTNYIHLLSTAPAGTVAHEIMHTLGFFHEHQRTDRSSYITIYTSNIESGKESNFYTYSQNGYNGYNVGSYDINSIMHYSSYAFSSNGNPTILTNSGATFSAQRSYLTSVDINSLKYIYGASSHLNENVIDFVSDITDTGRYYHAEYSNSVQFRDENGTNMTLTAPKLLVVSYHVQEYHYSPNNGYSSTSYQYYIVPAGASSFNLPNTVIERDEDAGEMRYFLEQSYSIII